MRYLASLASAVTLGLLMCLTPVLAQSGFDRRGGDYQSFKIREGNPEVCAARCEQDDRCRAWTFSYPRTADRLATCWLKDRVPARNEDKCCVSGVRGAGVIEPRKPEVEYSIDRWGGDLRYFEVPADATGAACQAACEEEKKCRAWTYVRPGYITPFARCYLKDRITRPRSKPCCISGVIR
jgi:hypothetical protein